tara:strand:- start:167 stop:601 length:435 start_codon:yes stop_codon:yes gene_type:complete
MSFNVVISSNKKVSGTNADATYNFQFQQFQQGDYEMSFAYQSSQDSTQQSNNILQIQLPDLPQMNYRADTKIGTASSGVIGMCYAEILGSKERYVARWGDNPPIYCRGLPSSGTFRVKLAEEADGGSTIDIPADYVLILSFKKL